MMSTQSNKTREKKDFHDIGSRKQLFIDHSIIEKMENLHLAVGKSEKYAGNPVLTPTQPWEYSNGWATVLYDPEEYLFKMWYQVRWHKTLERFYICYAISSDGIHWEKPKLGLFKYKGLKYNNIVLTQDIKTIMDAPSVIKDKTNSDSTRCYKMLIRENDRGVKGARAVFSMDGIHWKRYPVFPLIDTGDAISCYFDEKLKKYIAFTKDRVEGKRARFISVSRDFVNWSTPRILLKADDQDPSDVELYHNNGFIYEGYHIGLLDVFHTNS